MTNTADDKVIIDALAADDEIFVDDTSAGGATKSFTPAQMATFVGSSTTATLVTVADEATDTTCFIGFYTAATGDLGPKSNAGLTLNSSTSILTATGFAGPLTGNVTGNCTGTSATVTGAAQAAITSLGTLTTLTVDNLTVNGNTISSSSGNINITPVVGSAIVLDGAINIDAGVVTGATSITSTAFVGALTGNSDTTTALATARTIGGVSFDGTANIVPTTIAVTDTTDTTCFVALFESATGDLLPQTDLGITYNAGTASLATTTFVGALTGEADTVTTNANLTGHITSTGNAAVLGSFTSAQLATALTNETGSGAAVFGTSPTLVTPALGTPASGVMTNVTGTASSLTAGNVTTNANLTGPITSSGNATTIASQTGTGTKFVVDTSPTLVTPELGVATATSVTAKAGTGTGTYLTAGAINVDTAEVGNITTGEDDLITFSLPADSFSSGTKGVRVTMWGTSANNANAKTLRIFAGATQIGGISLLVNNAQNWKVTVLMFRTGSSTQDYNTEVSRNTAGAVDIIARESGTLALTDTSAIVLKATGEATATNDIIQKGQLVEFFS